MRVALILFLLLFSCLSASAAPTVVVSIKPLAGLVEGVMTGVGRPQLLLPGGASPHSYALRPSQMRALVDADLVVWVGPALESFLARPLQEASPGKTLQLSALKGARLLPAREGGGWDPHGDTGHGHHHAHDHGGTDPHLWLDPANARLLVSGLATRLAELDPENSTTYRRNAALLDQRLVEMTREVKAQLTPLQTVPYMVFHDAYQYFEAAFGLRPVGALAVQPERPPGARRVVEMRRAIEEKNVLCVFSEPQFEPRLIQALTEGTGAKVGELDPIGADLPEGPESYFMLMRGMGDALQSCLGGSKAQR